MSEQTTSIPPILWSPTPEAVERTQLADFTRWLHQQGHDVDVFSYEATWQWSVQHPEDFWLRALQYLKLRTEGPATPVLTDPALPGACWFPNLRLNYAEHALNERNHDGTAIVAYSQSRQRQELSWKQLRSEVARVAAALRGLGVGRGDRVAGYLPNIPEAIIAFLATASVGAVWTSCSVEFGAQAVADRLAQLRPKVLFTVPAYRYGTKTISREQAVNEVAAAVPSIEAVVAVPYLDQMGPASSSSNVLQLGWHELPDETAAPSFARVGFNDPLYILFSSGTSGPPKAIVHTHGGITLQHLKDLRFQLDLHDGDTFFWFTTTGWMMWNVLVSGLLVGATVVCFDGDPAFPDPDELWRIAARTGTTHLGLGAPFLTACMRRGARPAEQFDLTTLRSVGSTGAPLPAPAFDWVYRSVKPDVHLASVSGGTDVCCVLVGGAPTVPVWRGEISCRALGVAVDAFDGAGRSVQDAEGELVIRSSFPSMPLRLWDDPDGSRFRSSYFDTYPGVWRQGDWITITPRGSCIISGRSDATLNRGGVRIGTGEFYSVLDPMPELADSLVVHLPADGSETDLLLLFVVAASSQVEPPAHRIHSILRDRLSPRHVPDRIDCVPALPRTLTGKRLEIPIKRILQGVAVDDAVSRGFVTNPEALDFFVQYRRRHLQE